jgi:8-oxo-dGTP pyrophosphatase MutT (NUDIX family)
LLVKIKVIAYIYRKRNDQTEVLVFSHADFPEAGIQVVGGTLEEGEDHILALVREILEESGLIVSANDFKKVGETQYQRKDKPELNHRHYFKMHSNGLPDKWSHIVKSTGLDNGMQFDFFWLSTKEAREILTGNFGELL